MEKYWNSSNSKDTLHIRWIILKSCCLRLFLMFQQQVLTKWPLERSSEVIQGHPRLPKDFANNLWLGRARDVWMVSMSLPHQDTSTHMPYDLFGSPRDLDLGSNFELDISRSTCIFLKRLDESNTMVQKLLSQLYYFTSYLWLKSPTRTIVDVISSAEQM